MLRRQELRARRPSRRNPDVRRHVLQRHDLGRMGDWSASPRRSSVGRGGCREIFQSKGQVASLETGNPAVLAERHAIDSASLHNATVTIEPLAGLVEWHTITTMRRLRFLAGLLGCLAVLAASLPAVTLGSAASLNSAPAQTVASEPCDDCPDCQGAACQPTVVVCAQSCLTSASALGVAGFSLGTVSATETISLRPLAALHGRSPPPDPFPPRT